MENKTKFDEMQISKQNKYGKITLWMLLFFIFANAILKQFIGVYADPFAEAFLVITIPELYYLSMMILRHSYFTNDNKKTKATLIIFSLTAAFSAFNFFTNLFITIKNSNYKNHIIPSSIITWGFTFLIFATAVLMYFIRNFNDKNNKSE